jgi:hypothetical protein
MFARSFASSRGRVVVSCWVPGGTFPLVVEAARGAHVSSLVKTILSDGKLSMALQNAALWEVKSGKKVRRLDVLSTVDTLDGATLRLEAALPSGGGESMLRLVRRRCGL